MFETNLILIEALRLKRIKMVIGTTDHSAIQMKVPQLLRYNGPFIFSAVSFLSLFSFFFFLFVRKQSRGNFNFVLSLSVI